MSTDLTMCLIGNLPGGQINIFIFDLSNEIHLNTIDSINREPGQKEMSLWKRDKKAERS